MLEPYKFDLFEFRGRDRKLLGGTLAHQNRLAGHYCFGQAPQVIKTFVPYQSVVDRDENGVVIESSKDKVVLAGDYSSPGDELNRLTRIPTSMVRAD